MRITIRQLSKKLHKMSGLALRSAGFKLERWGIDSLQNKIGQNEAEPRATQLGIWRKPLSSKTQTDRKKGPLVLVPGFADSPLSWLPTMILLQNILADQFDEIVLIEFPGFHGYLYDEPSFHSIDAMLDVFVPAIDSLNPSTIVGHSLGGGLAAHYAAIRGHTHPKENHLEHVILISPSGVFVDEAFRSRIESRIIEIVENGIECLREIHPALLDKNNRLNRIATELMAFASQEEIRQFVRSFRDDHLLEPLLPQVRARVDLIWGTNDRLIPPTVIPCWLEGLKHTRTRVVRMKGIGHAPQFEAPKRLTSILSRLIQPPELRSGICKSRMSSLSEAGSLASPPLTSSAVAVFRSL